MKTANWHDEEQAFKLLDRAERVDWLARLAAALTVAARDTYEVGEDGIQDPRRMRRFNELIHRTVNQLRHALNGDQGFPDDIFHSMIRDETQALGVDFSMLNSLM